MRFRILRGFGGSFFWPIRSGIAQVLLGHRLGASAGCALRLYGIRPALVGLEALVWYCRRNFRAFRARRNGHSNSGAAFNAASARLPPRFGGDRLKPALGVVREPPLVFERLVNLYYFF